MLALGAERIGRRTDGVRALAVASLIMAAWDPGVVWDVGYQLSAGATLGLILSMLMGGAAQKKAA